MTAEAVSIAIELETSYQIWRVQHERYLLLSRRAWLNNAAASEMREHGQQRGHADVNGDRDYAGQIPCRTS